MGIPYLWPFVRKKGYEARLQSQFPQNPLLPGSFFRVDILGSMYTTIRRAFLNHDSTTANRIFEYHLQSLQLPQSTTILYLDGPSPEEKRATLESRESRRTAALKKADALLSDMETIVQEGRRLRKQHFWKLRKSIDASFYLLPNLRTALAQYLRDKGWRVIECPSEADIAIAIDCTTSDIVITGDSDSLIHSSVHTIWKPLARGGYLVYDVPRLLQQLELSRTGLTVLGIVCRNDYTSNMKQMGLVTNYELIQSLEGGVDADQMVQAYMAHEEVAFKNPSKLHFEPALRVFAHREFTLPSLSSSPQVLQGDPAQGESQSSVTLEDIQAKLIMLKDQMRAKKERSISDPSLDHAGDRPKFNRYDTVDRAPVLSPPPHTSGRKYKYRQRYAIKTRSRMVKHEPPDVLKQFVWKPWTKIPESPKEPISPPKPEAKSKKRVRNLDDMEKRNLVKELQWEHPTRVLNVGTINANVSRALAKESLPPEYLPQIKTCFSDIAKKAAKAKRTCQLAIGQYLEQLSLENVDEQDRLILARLCRPFTAKDVIKDEDIEAEQDAVERDDQERNDECNDSNDSKNETLKFFLSLLTAIYNSKCPPLHYTDTTKPTPENTSKTVLAVRACWVKAKNFLPEETGEADGVYPASTILQSTALNLSVEFNRHFRNGSIDLAKKIRILKKKGLLPLSAVDNIDPKLSPAENFIILNRISGCRRRLSPLSSMETKFVGLSELDLTKVFWQNDVLRQLLQQCASVDFPSLEPHEVTQYSVGLWLSRVEPGYLINLLLTDIGGYSMEERRKKRNLSRCTLRMPIDATREHLRGLRRDTFDPSSYTTKGYVLRGSIRFDGFRLQVLAFKLNELNCVKYRRLPPERLPHPVTTTLGGTDYFLSEIRNVVTSKEDVAALWACDPSQIKILGIDLGQAFVVGASALLPSPVEPVPSPMSEVKEGIEDKQTRTAAPKFFNLAVKQKAVYQPTFKHRNWLEHRKGRASEGQMSITEIETKLPALRGSEASIKKFVVDLEKGKAQLEGFYGDVVLKKHKWNAQKAKDEEYRIIANRLLELVGGSLGAKRDKDNKVVIGVGLGQFSSKIRLSSLHESFQSYFVQKARSLGYIVIGVNEYYTSQRCPVCEEFVGKVDMRRFYCLKCKAFMHRDVMAGHNIANAVRGHLLTQQRPRYLQPRDVNGNYPWEERRSVTFMSHSGGSSEAASSSEGAKRAGMKRKVPVESQASKRARVKRKVPVEWTEEEQDQE